MNPAESLSGLTIGPLDHVAIAVRDIDEAAARYAPLGARLVHREEVAGQGVEVAFLEVPGTTTLELVSSTREDSPIVSFIERRGETLHHICFRVDDIEAALADARELGMRLIDNEPRPGAKGSRIAFIHPQVTGILVELKQPA